MFYGSVFDGDISNWDVSKVKDMSYMFENSMFNRDISSWDLSSLTDATDIFERSMFAGYYSKLKRKIIRRKESDYGKIFYKGNLIYDSRNF